MKIYTIAAIPGDGIGKEVIAAGIEVSKVCAATDGSFSIASTAFEWGSDYYKQHGVMIPENGLDQLRPFDAIYFGAVGAPDVPDHIPFGASGFRSASLSTNTQTYARHGFFRALKARCATQV